MTYIKQSLLKISTFTWFHTYIISYTFLLARGAESGHDSTEYLFDRFFSYSLHTVVQILHKKTRGNLVLKCPGLRNATGRCKNIPQLHWNNKKSSGKDQQRADKSQPSR